MENSLSLARAAVEGFWRAVVFYLGDVATDCTPAFDLPFVVDASAAVVVATVPLKPPARVFVIDPAFLAPDRQRLRSVYAEEVEFRIAALGRKLSFLEPIGREFAHAVRHVLAAENAKREHLFRRQFGPEIGMKIFSDRLDEQIRVVLLHLIVDLDPTFCHITSLTLAPMVRQ